MRSVLDWRRRRRAVEALLDRERVRERAVLVPERQRGRRPDPVRPRGRVRAMATLLRFSSLPPG